MNEQTTGGFMQCARCGIQADQLTYIGGIGLCSLCWQEHQSKIMRMPIEGTLSDYKYCPHCGKKITN